MRLSLAIGFIFVGCTVPYRKLLSELNAEQAQSVCEEYAEREIICGDEGSEETFYFGSECEKSEVSASCTATVGDYRACQEAVDLLSDQAFCDSEGFPGVCDPLLDGACVQPKGDSE